MALRRGLFIRLLHRRSYSKDSVVQIFSVIENKDTKVLQELIKTNGVLLKARNEKGYTPLLHAARVGDLDAVDLLLREGADPNATDRLGHTARDLAIFFNHQEKAQLLQTSSIDQNNPPYFSQNPLSRESNSRSQIAKLEDLFSRKDAVFLPVINGIAELITDPQTKRTKLKLLSKSDVTAELSAAIFLGVHVVSKQPYFAILEADPEVKADPRQMFRLAPPEAAIAAQAQAMADWNTRNMFCPTCGSATFSADGGYKRKCSNNDCITTKRIMNTTYPRFDPTVVTMVTSKDNKSCLLGRQKSFPSGMFSCLSGFIEPGETIEMAAAREVFEETGVSIQHVRYHSSQAWPMPTTLMVGCYARAKSEEITLDENELEAAFWVNRKDVVYMILREHPDGLFVPPNIALAHNLLKHWLLESAFLT